MSIQKATWILNHINGFGIQKYKRLCEEIKDPATLLHPEILERLTQLPDFGLDFTDQVQVISDSGEFEKELEQCNQESIQIITLSSSAYPKNLASIYDPPFLLYVKGDLIPEDEVSIAIVGSRHATSYGFRIAGRFAEELAEKGVTIVSGFARGIDSEAHRGAMRAKGRTIAVLGSGLDIIYPKEHQELYQDILSSGGILMSEFPMGMPPLAVNFPKRNRIISGLAMGVLVVEASRRSGSLITARCAAEEGREVYVIPGPIDSTTSSGTNELVQQGAKLVTCADNILEDLTPQLRASLNDMTSGLACHPEERGDEESGHGIPRPFGAQNDSATEPGPFPQSFLKKTPDDPILNLLTKEPLSLDEIAASLGQDFGKIRSQMIKLELKGCVKRVFGGSYVQNSHMTKRLK